MSVSSLASLSSLSEWDEENFSDKGSWHSCEDKENESLSKLQEKLFEQVKRSTKMANTLEKQIAAFDEYNGGFEHWYNEKFKLVLKAMKHRARQEKNLDTAYELKKMAEAYLEWKDSAKAFDYMNRAIKAVPCGEKSFLGNSFALRAELHMQLNSDASSALADLEKALLCRPNSYTCIRRKVDILCEAKRNVEAFSFLNELLNKTDRAKITAQQMDRLHQLHADLSQYEPENEAATESKAKSRFSSVTTVVSIDKRLKMVQNGSHKRYGLFAVEDIAARRTVVTERPALFALKDDGRKQFCSNCWLPCKSTFWPCGGCTEVQYCSSQCAAEDEAKGHAASCGFLQHLQLESSTNVNSIMLLQYLVQHGHQKMVAAMSRGSSESESKQQEEAEENFKLDECFNELASGSLSMTAEQMSAAFFRRQNALLRNFNESGNQYCKRNSHHIAYSVYILSLYLHYAKVEPESLGKATIQGLLRQLSIQLYYVALGEYSWTNRSTGGEKTSNASFLCLFSSTVGHSCKANAEWQFTADGNFTLRTTAPVDAGAELAISYGVNSTDTPSLYTRLATLSRFGCLCACASCLADSKTVFALQCRQGICRGPVPWSATSFPNDLCIICEQKYPDGIEVAKTVQKEMESTKKAICLLFVVDDSDNSSTYVQQIEAKLAKIAEHIYSHNVAFQSMVLDLCEYYMSRGMHRQAVNWFQWFAIEQDIFLSATEASGGSGSAGDGKKKDDNKVERLLTRFHFLDKWCNAYLCVLESEMSSSSAQPKEQQCSADGLSSHLNVANKLLTQLNGVIVDWASLSPTASPSCATLLSSIGSDMQQMGDHLSALSSKHSRRYTTLLNQLMDSAIKQTSLMKVVRAASSAAFDLNTEQQQQQPPAPNAKMPESISGNNSSNNFSVEEQKKQIYDSDDELEIHVIGPNSSSSETVKADK